MTLFKLFKDRLLSTLVLFWVTVACVILITITNQITKDKIHKNKQRAALNIITEVISANYDNELLTDKIDINVPEAINKTKMITAYRARLNSQPIGVALMPVTTNGYNGEISLVVGVAYDGSILGIKVLSHNETEGFGGNIVQDKSNWLNLFLQKNILTTPEEKWALKKDNGTFDQLSGATITSRSVVNVIYQLLAYYMEHRDQLYRPLSGPKY